MSEQAFKDAKGHLAFSQGLVDKMRAQQNPQQDMQQPQDTSQAQQELVPQETPPQQAPQEQPAANETGLLTNFMNEVRALFKTNEDAEQKTQQLVEQHNQDMTQIKSSLSEILNEDSQQK